MCAIFRITFALVASSFAAMSGSCWADDDCTSVAQLQHVWPVDHTKDEFKFKFRILSDCIKTGCAGFVHYRIHYNSTDGGSSTKTTQIKYSLLTGHPSSEVVATVFPSGGNKPVYVQDVEIQRVSCSTP